MSKEQIYKIVKGVILFIFGLFDIFLIIRILLKLIGASRESSFVKFWYNISNPLYLPFEGTVRDLASDNIVVELNSILAILLLAVLAIFAIRVVEGIFKDKFNDKMKSLVDTFFKVAETILGLRLFFRLIGAGKSSFITVLYAVSSPFYEPFKGILPTIGSGNIVFETSTFIAIIIFVIFDFASEKLFTELGKGGEGIGKNYQKKYQQNPHQQVPIQPQSNQQSPTVNVTYTPPANNSQQQTPMQQGGQSIPSQQP